MKCSCSCNPVVKSVGLLLFLSLMIGLMLSSGGFFAGIGAFFGLVFATIKWVIALTVGLLISLAVLFAIFFIAVAIYDKQASLEMFEKFKLRLKELAEQYNIPCPCLKGEKKTLLADVAEGTSSDGEGLLAAVQEEIEDVVESSAVDVDVVKQELLEKIAELEGMLRQVEGKAAASEQVDSVAAEVSKLKETVGTADSGLQELHGKVAEVESKVEPLLADLPARIEKLEKQPVPEKVDIAPVKTEVSELQKEVVGLKELVAKMAAEGESGAEIAELKQEIAALKKDIKSKPKAAAPGKKAAPARKPAKTNQAQLLSYYDDPADQAKVEELVKSTLKKDMTYGQVMDFLIEEMGEEKSKPIVEHPTLTKDYIRMCRKNA